MADPAIILVSEHHAGVLLEEFESRYQRDYDLRTATNTAQAEDVAREIGDAGGLVAMFVTDSRLPDVDHIFEAIHRWRVVVPTARRVVAAHWDHFLADGPGLRIGLAKGKYDAYLLMPRGKRDEEFHNAITDLLSDWTSTVPQPEVVTAKIISPTRDSLTMAIRDFLDRMGMQNRVWHPDAPELQDYLGGIGSSWASRSCTGPSSSRPTGRRSRPRASGTWPSRSTDAPAISRSTRSWTSRSSAEGRPGWRRRSTEPQKGSRSSSWTPRRSAARPAPAR